MLKRIILFLTGFGLIVIGFSYIIMYFTLFSMGYSFIEYLLFIIKRVECLFVLFGLILIIIAINKGDGKK